MPRFALTAVALAGAAFAAQASEAPRSIDLQDFAARLRGGGMVLYMRHPETDRAQADSDALDFADCSTQRNLNDTGRRTAAAIGSALRAAGAALDRAVTSQYCRARETADLMGVASAVETDGALNDGGRMAAAGPDSPRAEAVRAMLRKPPAPGRSTLIVAHRSNLVDAAGPAFADMVEGEIAAFRPAPGEPLGFQALLRIRPQDWALIVAAAPRD